MKLRWSQLGTEILLSGWIDVEPEAVSAIRFGKDFPEELNARSDTYGVRRKTG
jgi:hypothetical protein